MIVKVKKPFYDMTLAKNKRNKKSRLLRTRGFEYEVSNVRAKQLNKTGHIEVVYIPKIENEKA